MKAINRFFISLFCFVFAGIFSIVGLVINSIANQAGIVSKELGRKLDWFSSHSDESKMIAWSLLGFAGLLGLIGIITVARIIRDKKTTSDQDLGVDYKRLED